MIHACPDGACAIGKPLIFFYPGKDVFTAEAWMERESNAAPEAGG